MGVNMARNATDRVGMTFGRLTVLSTFLAPVKVKGRDKHETHAQCRCSCGAFWVGRMNQLVSGKTGSCGCLQREAARAAKTTHGATAGYAMTPEYQSWRAMKARCYNPRNIHYRDYGARGVSVHPAWIQSYSAFFAYIGPRPHGHTLDRIDPNGNYEPGNVRWATPSVQSANQRRWLRRAA